MACLFAAMTFAGCANYDVVPAGAEDCPIPQMGFAAIADYRLIDGDQSKVFLADQDGSVMLRKNHDPPIVTELGAHAPAELRASLEDSGVFEVQQGCYLSGENDHISSSLMLLGPEDQPYWFARVDEADVPGDLEDAFDIVDEYVTPGDPDL